MAMLSGLLSRRLTSYGTGKSEMVRDYPTIDSWVAEFEPRIRRAVHLRRNVVFGMDREDVCSEMLVTLVQVWKWGIENPAGVDVTPVFWTAWNRRLQRLRQQTSARFDVTVAAGLPDDLDYMGIVPPETVPVGLVEMLCCLDPEEEIVARMRSEGFRRDEVMSILGISRREYYKRWERVVSVLA